MNDLGILKNEERINLFMRRLYELYGYKKYRMNKFEEYSFYIQNKSFLESDRFITFNDPDGRLMALKPDVTLSIAKNSTASEENQRIYYSESIFRTRGSSGEFAELRQTGLEFIGSIDIFATTEVVSLALQTLEIISGSYVLSLSHMGVISAVLEGVTDDYSLRRRITGCIRGKNLHDLRMICAQAAIAPEAAGRLEKLISIRGRLNKAAAELEQVFGSDAPEAIAELKSIASAFENTQYAEHLQLDMSAVSSTDYYNGILLSGFVQGVAHSVITGGRYDYLLRRLGKDNLNAMGFAVNFCYLERMLQSREVQQETAVLYDDTTPPSLLEETMRKMTADGEKVRAVRAGSGLQGGGLQYGKAVDLTVGGGDGK